MNRFAIVVLAVGVVLSSGLASQGRGQFGGESGSAPLIPALVQPAGATQRGGSGGRSPGVQTAAFELMATLPGVPLYARYGFREVERVSDRMPSGIVLEFVRMRL